MVNPSEERRGFVRIPFNTEAEVAAGGKTVRSRDGIDISMSGLRIDCGEQADFAVGTPCEVRISLTASEASVAVEAKGTIVRSDKGRLGIRFTEIDLDSYQHLRQLILNNTTDPERAEREFFSHWGIRPLNPPKND